MSTPTATEQNLFLVFPAVVAIALLQRGYIFFKVENSYGPFTEGEVQLVQHLWEEIKKLGVILFKNSVTAAPLGAIIIAPSSPSALSFFLFKGLPNLYSEALTRHSKSVVTTVRATVDGLREVISKYRDLLLIIIIFVWYCSTQFTIQFKLERKAPIDRSIMATPTTTEQNLLFVVPAVVVIALLELLQRGYMYFKTQKTYGPFTEREVQIVQKSWEEVKKLGLENVGVLLFKNIFTSAPSALSFFSFKDLPNLYESKAFKRHGKSVVTTVGAAVGGLREVSNLIPILGKCISSYVYVCIYMYICM
jgi:hypothetical protein